MEQNYDNCHNRIYWVTRNIGFNYKTFPYIEKKRGKVNWKWDCQAIVAFSEYEAKEKFLTIHGQPSFCGMWKYSDSVNGLMPILCKNPEFKVDIEVNKISWNVSIGDFLEYMTVDDFSLLNKLVL